MLAALRNDRIAAPCVIDGPINGDIFRAYIEQVLVPALKPVDIVIIDNLGSHKGKALRAAIRVTGAKLFFLPNYSPDLNPIEQVFAKLKTLLRKSAERTGGASVTCSTHSAQRNVPTTSEAPDMLQKKQPHTSGNRYLLLQLLPLVPNYPKLLVVIEGCTMDPRRTAKARVRSRTGEVAKYMIKRRILLGDQGWRTSPRNRVPRLRQRASSFSISIEDIWSGSVHKPNSWLDRSTDHRNVPLG